MESSTLRASTAKQVHFHMFSQYKQNNNTHTHNSNCQSSSPEVYKVSSYKVYSYLIKGVQVFTTIQLNKNQGIFITSFAIEFSQYLNKKNPEQQICGTYTVY